MSPERLDESQSLEKKLFAEISLFPHDCQKGVKRIAKHLERLAERGCWLEPLPVSSETTARLLKVRKAAADYSKTLRPHKTTDNSWDDAWYLAQHTLAFANSEINAWIIKPGGGKKTAIEAAEAKVSQFVLETLGDKHPGAETNKLANIAAYAVGWELAKRLIRREHRHHRPNPYASLLNLYALGAVGVSFLTPEKLQKPELIAMDFHVQGKEEAIRLTFDPQDLLTKRS